MLSKDYKILSLSNFTVDEIFFVDIKNESNPYQKLFEIIDLFEVTEHISINNNYLDDLPDNMIKFSKLKSLEIIGHRWWDLKSSQMPKNLEELIVEARELPCNFLCNIDKNLPNLKILGCDMDAVFSTALHKPLPYLHNLEELYLYNPNFSLIRKFLQHYNIEFLEDNPLCDVYITVIRFRTST